MLPFILKVSRFAINMTEHVNNRCAINFTEQALMKHFTKNNIDVKRVIVSRLNMFYLNTQIKMTNKYI